MIQLLGLRKFVLPDGKDAGKEITHDAFHNKNWRVTSVKELFLNLEKHLEQIPVNDRWNMFYTIAECGEEKRKFKRQAVLPFDFDYIDKTQIDKYVKIFHDVLKLSPDDTARVSSGNGLHIILELAQPFESADFFEKNRHHFKAIANRINYALARAELPGSVDTSIFGPAKILRLPGTANRKPDRPDTTAVLLKADMKPIDFNLSRESGLPDIKPKEQLSERTMRKFHRSDNEAVLSGCSFLKWAKENPDQVDEPTWYAGLSIVARLEDGREEAHKFSAGHSSYNREETDHKVDQALEASGPRTCDNINTLWGKCAECPNFKKKLSPIMLVGEGHIATEQMGFHTVTMGAKGEVYKPCYEDLRLYYKREFNYKVLGGSRMCMKWNGMHYEAVSNAEIEEFSYHKFDPKPAMSTRKEFRDLVTATEIRAPEWFEETTIRKVNFLNGYYDLDKNEFLPHSPDVGFCSVLPFKYAADATCPTYDRMLDKITHGRESIQNVLNEAGGYAISGDRYWLHKAVVLLGEGSNGKSTWLNILKAIVGTGNFSSLTISDLQRSEYNRQTLDKKLLNVSEEMPTKDLTETSLFKTLTSGLELSVRAPYKEPYEMRNKAKMFFTCNELPMATDTSHGFFRRLLIIPFDYRFSKNDPDFDPFIEEKMTEELPGIFNRFLEGYVRLLKQRDFTECKAIAERLEIFKEETDTLATWIRQNMVFHPVGSEQGKFVTVPQIFSEYSTEMKSHGFHTPNNVHFGRSLARLIPDYASRVTVKRIDNTKVARGLLNADICPGIGLAEFDSMNQFPPNKVLPFPG